MFPAPRLRVEQKIFSILRLFKPMAAETISMIESIAPISWKCTSWGLQLWTVASASAIFLKTVRANDLAFFSILLFSIISVICLRFRWCFCFGAWGLNVRALMPALVVLVTWILSPLIARLCSPAFRMSKSRPASSIAAVIISPEAPAQQSKYAIFII